MDYPAVAKNTEHRTYPRTIAKRLLNNYDLLSGAGR